MNKIEVYDIETLKSCFTYTGLDIKTNKISQFVLHKERNDLSAFISHLSTLYGGIGFNNLNFDYPILHHIINNRYKYAKLNIESIILDIYNKAQSIINEQNNSPFNTVVSIKQKDWYFKQLDLFKIWHFNNVARRTSLKSLEIAMNMPNVMEMPISHTREDITLEEVNDILAYNLNDVEATYEFYKKTTSKINQRNNLKKTYDLWATNYSDSKIGEELTLKLFCDDTGMNRWDVNKMRSNRLKIALKDIIFDYISFKTNEFNNVLNIFKNTILIQTKGGLSKNVIFKGFKYDYGSGGIHGCIRSGIYESEKDYLIIDADVGSLYPSIAVVNELYPEHLGKSFCKVYKRILEERLIAKKNGKIDISNALKLALNSVYGKSNDINSFLYDPLYTMSITVNGQLMLSMLAESLVLNIPNVLMLQINTDGLTIKIRREYLDLYYKLCKDWEKLTRLNLEYVEYSKMIIRDVNNYIAVSKENKIKCKGAFKTNSQLIIDEEWHKDFSFNIIRIALLEYFTKGISVEQTIKNHTNIYDFCGRQKFGKDSYGEIHQLSTDKTRIDIYKQQKNTRYYITTNGGIFIKRYTKGTSEMINKGFKVKEFNKFNELNISDYNIDYTFYIKECYKEINQILPKQCELLFNEE